jgi:vanillate/3-O-methylgallate O-demethylase
MSHQSLDDALREAGSAVALARGSQLGPYIYPGVPSEFTNWREEQTAWRESCALFDQSHHMTDLYVEGPDAIKLMSDLGVNSFANFMPQRAKQFVACSPDGQLIGDAVLFHHEQDRLSLVGRASALNWVQYNAEVGGYDVAVYRDERTLLNRTGRRKVYRYQVQGPQAMGLLQKVTGGDPLDVKFFHLGELAIGGCRVGALGHGMAGAEGLELYGPWEDREIVKAAIVEAGREFGLRQVGSRAYASNALESGWLASPIPGIYTGAALRGYRQWLPADGFEATGSLGGSFYSDEIADYYLDPYEIGYGTFVKFDHDFVGREALMHLAESTRRRKVTLAWNGDDVTRVIGTMFGSGHPNRYIDFPLPAYSIWPYDEVDLAGRCVGLSTYIGYSYNERSMLSLAILDREVAIGQEVTLIWGERDGGSNRPVVERHEQCEIRAVVSPCPFSKSARENYHRGGWRSLDRAWVQNSADLITDGRVA